MQDPMFCLLASSCKKILGPLTLYDSNTHTCNKLYENVLKCVEACEWVQH